MHVAVDHSVASMKSRLLIAITIIAALAIGGFLLSNLIYAGLSHNFETVNMAGRQRTLSQRIGLLAGRALQAPTDAMRADEWAEIAANVAQMRKSQHDLDLFLVRHDDISWAHAKRVASFDRDGLDRLLREYYATAQAMIDTRDAGERETLTARLTAMGRDDLLTLLEAQVSYFQQLGYERAALVHHIHQALMAAILLALLAEWIWLFRPLMGSVIRNYRAFENLNRTKSEFMANMSHEFRTPINAIFGIGEVLLQSELTGKQRSQVQTLIGSADNLLNIIDDVLDFSKMEAGKLEIEQVAFDMHAAVEDVAQLLASKAHAKRLEIIHRYMPGTPQFVLGDPGRFRQILVNLVGNAVKFTETGHILITVERDSEMVGDACMIRCTVEDTGIGIPADKLETIFHMFAQGDSSATRRYGGTGLGLTICRQLAALMGGEVGVRSTEHEGSAFWFTLAVKKSELVGRFEPNLNVLAHRRALVVDDIEANRDLLVDHLSHAQMLPHAVVSGMEALRELKRAAKEGKPYDLVVSDFLMPEMSGETLVRAMKHEPALQAIPVIIVSSADERGLVRTFSQLGVAGYLAKPLRRAQLLDMLALVLETQAHDPTGAMLTVHGTEAMRAREHFDQAIPLAGVRVLLTEDNRINREFTTELLELMGCIVEQAENGAIAVEKCTHQSYDIILMDCQMPVMDGFDATRAIQALKSRGVMENTPVIALTANAMVGDRERCLRAGMHDYLSKPVRRSDLEAMLLRWWQRTGAPTTAPAEESPPATIPQPLAKEFAMEPFNTTMLHETRTLLGGRFYEIVEYFIEDGGKYMDSIERALSDQKTEAIVAPAHTLKSSARQFGLNALSNHARHFEESARTGGAEVAENLKTQLNALRQHFNDAVNYLRDARAA